MSDLAPSVVAVREAHELTVLTERSPEFLERSATCSCGTVEPFNWAFRYQEFLDHLHWMIFQAGWAAGASTAEATR